MFAPRSLLIAASLLASALSFSATAQAGCYQPCVASSSYYSPYSNGLRTTYGHAGSYNHSYSYGVVNRQAYSFATPVHDAPSYMSEPRYYRPAYRYAEPRYSQPRLRRHVSYKAQTAYVPVTRVKTMTVLKAIPALCR